MTTSLRLIALSIAALGLASCQSSKTNADPYASNAAGGGYNPYPDSGGAYASNSASAPSYQTPPSSAPAPQYDPYAYTAPKTTPSGSSSAPKSTAKKKTTASTSTKKKSPTSSSSKRHTVKQGETLYGIARTNHTTVAKLKAANGISSDIIRPGQTLKIP